MLNKFLIIFGLLIFSGLVAFGFDEPPSNDKNLSLETYLNEGPVTQSKRGGLGVNSGISQSGLGLIISPGGFSIGNTAFPEQVYVAGNLGITSGAIKPVNQSGKDEGSADEVLTNISQRQMKWGNVAWLSIRRIDIVQGGSCSQIFPACPAGWTFYDDEITDAGCPSNDGIFYGYGGSRVCSKNF